MDFPILGVSTRSVESLNKWLKSKNCPEYADLYRIAGEKYGVRWDIAIFQSCLETGWFWQNSGPFDVKASQNNFAGLGATGDGVCGDSFATPALGIEAQMQDLALRSGVKIPRENVLSQYVHRPEIYEIVANRNTKYWSGLAGTWSMDPNYWKNIQAVMAKYDAWAHISDNPIVLDPGHSLSRQGACSNDGTVKEEILNEKCALEMLKVFTEANEKADIFNPDPDDLTAVGKKGWGKCTAMISYHHNSYEGSGNPYHCIMIDPAAPQAWKEYASKMCIVMAKALDGTIADTKVFEGTNGLAGVYEAELSVLNTSAKDPDGKPPFHCLIEAYFLNKMTDEEACEKVSVIAARAIAKFMVENPWPGKVVT